MADMPIATPRPIEKLRIVLYPDPALRKKCKPVEQFDEELAALADRMLKLMRDAKGVGLAAPQVGVLLRMFVCNPTGEPGDDQVWFNPVLPNLEGMAEAEEGCLSLPNVNVPKRRAQRAVIEGYDAAGNPKRAEGSDLVARIWQHETD
jgi:peptide deformylase